MHQVGFIRKTLEPNLQNYNKAVHNNT